MGLFAYSVVYFVIIRTLISQMIINPQPITEINLTKLKNISIRDISLTSDNKYLCIASEENGFNIIDISDILNPTIIYSENFKKQGASSVSSVYVVQQYLVVVDRYQGIRIYNMYDINNIKIVGYLNLKRELQVFLATSDFKYGFAIGNGIVTSIDLNNISQPQPLNTAKADSAESFKLHFFNQEQYLSIANGNGACIMDIRDKKAIRNRYEARVFGSTYDFIVLNDNKTALLVEFFYGLFKTDISALYQTEDMITLKWDSFYRFNEFIMTLGRSKDDSYILVGTRSSGIYLFSFQKQNFNIIEKIPGDHLCTRLIFSNGNNDQYLLVSTGVSLVIYERSEPNFNKDFPNFFNSFQSSVSYIGQTTLPWNIKAFSDSKRVAVALAQDSAKIIDISDPYKPTDIYKFPVEQGVAYDGLTFSKDENILYIGASQKGVYAYDISDITNIKKLSQHVPIPQKPDSNDSDEIVFDQSGNIGVISNGFAGIEIVDYTNKDKPVPLVLWINNLFKGSFEKSLITQDNKYIYSACRDYGVVAFYFDSNAQKKQVQIIDQLNKVGTEEIVFSQDQNYIFSANGYSGFLVIDISTKNKLNLVKQVILDGWVQTITVLNNEQYIIVGHIENGQLTLINLSDKKNPYIQAKFRNKGENAISVVKSIDQKSLFFIGNMGMRFLPLDLDLTIHTQQRLVNINQNTKEVRYSQIPTSDSFKVGQDILLTFVPVKTRKEIIIENVYYYEDYETKPIPFWMKYVQLTRSLSLKIDKTATQMIQGFNTIILSVLVKVESTDFLTKDLIDTKLSNQILKCLIQQEYIDSSQFLKSKFDPKLDFNLNYYDKSNFLEADYQANNSQVQLIIKKRLIYSYFRYPVQFKVESSLKLNFTAELNFIESSSSYIYIYVDILQQMGSFVEKVYNGALVSFSQDKQQVKIEGPRDAVNQILKKTLKIATQIDSSKIKISTRIQDDANYDIITEEYLSNISFISLHSKVLQVYPLQEQINKQYDNGNLYVEEKFSLKIFPYSFQNEDTQSELKYHAFLFSGGEWEPLTSLNWIEFNSLELTFSGQRSRYQLWSSEKIKIVATDSHTEAEDTFEIHFNQIPIILILEIAVQILGPIIGFLGLFSYRSYIYTMFFKSWYYYRRENIKVGKFFHKEIIIVKSFQKDIQQLWSKIKQQEKRNLISEIYKLYKESNQIDLTNLLALSKKIYDDQKQLFINIDEQEFNLASSRLYKIFHSYVVEIILQKDPYTNGAYKYFVNEEKNKSQTKDWFRNSVTIIHQNIEQFISFTNISLIQKESITKSSIDKNYKDFLEVQIKQNYVKGILLKRYDLQKLDYYLFCQQLQNDVIGYNLQKSSRLNPCKGYSMYLSPSQISCIQAYQKIHGCCYWLRKKFAQNYQPIGLNKNNPLPIWMNCKIQDDTLHIYGYPQIEDIGEILIRIYDTYDLGIMQFKLNIEESIENANNSHIKRKQTKLEKISDRLSDCSQNDQSSQKLKHKLTLDLGVQINSQDITENDNFNIQRVNQPKNNVFQTMKNNDKLQESQKMVMLQSNETSILSDEYLQRPCINEIKGNAFKILDLQGLSQQNLMSNKTLKKMNLDDEESRKQFN